jgi:hypothetical protein
MDHVNAQLFSHGMVLGGPRSVLLELLRRLCYCHCGIHSGWTHHECYSQVSMQNEQFCRCAGGKLHVGPHVCHILWRIKYAHLIRVVVLSILRRSSVGSHCKGMQIFILVSDVQELEASNFWLELPKIVKGFKWMYLFVFAMTTAMVMIAYVVPQDWRITGFYSTVPLGVMLASHALFPITVSKSNSLLTVIVEPPIDDIHFLIQIRSRRFDGSNTGRCYLCKM